MNIGQFDQIKEMIKDITEMAATAYKGYKNQGFDEVQALHLTLNFQTNLMGGAKKE